MKKFWQRLPVILVLLVLGGWLLYGFLPAPIQVEVVQATRGNVQVTVNDDGKTRIREKFLVSAPVFGKVFRIELNEGDAVVAGQTVLAMIEPSDPSLLDARARAEAEARVGAADSAIRQAEATLRRAQQAHELAVHAHERARQLVTDHVISRSEFDEAEHRQEMALADVHSAEFAAAVAKFEFEQAEAALVRIQPDVDGTSSRRTMTITAPVDGTVLRVVQESAGVVQPGTPLLEIGDPRDLEMLIDVLSTDAVKIQRGAQVFVEHWGGEIELEGRVRIVEPSGFSKISALGVEEQRVNVLSDFTSPFEDRRTLGDGFRIEVRIVVAEADDVIKVPVGALFRERGAWHVFRIVDGRAALQAVEVGLSSGQEVEITSGIAEGETLILYPTDDVRDGSRIRVSSSRPQSTSIAAAMARADLALWESIGTCVARVLGDF